MKRWLPIILTIIGLLIAAWAGYPSWRTPKAGGTDFHLVPCHRIFAAAAKIGALRSSDDSIDLACPTDAPTISPCLATSPPAPATISVLPSPKG